MAEMDVAAYLKRTEESFDKEDYDQAISDLTEVIRLEPDNAEAKSNLYIAQFNLGIKHFQEGDIDQAISDLTAAIRLDPNNATGYGARGMMYDQIKNTDGAIDDLTEAIRLDPADASSYVIRAGAYHDKSKEYRLKGDQNNFFKYLDLSIRDYETALEIKPDNAQTRKMLKIATEERESWKVVAEGLKTEEEEQKERKYEERIERRRIEKLRKEEAVQKAPERKARAKVIQEAAESKAKAKAEKEAKKRRIAYIVGKTVFSVLYWLGVLALIRAVFAMDFISTPTVKPIISGSFVSTGIILAVITKRGVTGFIVHGIIGAIIGWFVQVFTVGGYALSASSEDPLKIVIPLLFPLITLYILVMTKWRRPHFA